LSIFGISFVCFLKGTRLGPRLHHVQKVHLHQGPRGARQAQGLRPHSITTVSIRASVKAFGPFGDFVEKETENEMIYLGGGAGTARTSRNSQTEVLSNPPNARDMMF
jgi:Na+-transporting NADH:ubiquinone oxidoreductase subunit NqrF